MTDPNDFDELASAHLDAATSPEEAAAVAADPALQARVEELRAVREAMASTPPVDPEHREAAIAAALTAFDADEPAEHPSAPVTPLAPRRSLSPTAVRALGAAAVALLIALLVPLLISLDGDDETATFESTGDAIDSELDSGGTEEAPAAAGGSNSTMPVPAGAPTLGGVADLGTFEDLDDLAAAVAAAPFAEERATGFDDEDAARFCTAAAAEQPAAVAVVDGRPVVVYVRSESDGRRTMTVLLQGSCEQLDEREL